MIKLIECSRDAMQGMHRFIPTKDKTSYIQSLLSVGFNVIDCGSFVSPKAVPQMRDTAEVLDNLDTRDSKTKLSVIVGNVKGAKRALTHKNVDLLGFPFSVSEIFQQKNTNASREEGFDRVRKIHELCLESDRELLVYVSMAFGNPYGEEWSRNLVMDWIEKIAALGIKTINLSDTIGTAKVEDIKMIFSHVIQQYETIEFGAHFHSVYDGWRPKIESAYDSGCKRFDGAILGYGGCPMSGSEMLGNIPTEKLITFFNEKKEPLSINPHNFESAFNKALTLFGNQ